MVTRNNTLQKRTKKPFKDFGQVSSTFLCEQQKYVYFFKPIWDDHKFN